MTDAVAAYEEKARDLWLFDYPAQVSLCGTQVWWTTEVLKYKFFNLGFDNFINQYTRAVIPKVFF